MTMIYAIHAPDADRLAEVSAEMAVMGAPTIRVVDCGDYYQALEGSHRLAAAHALGLTPELVVYEQDEVIDIAGYDWFDASTWTESGAIYTAGEVAGELHSVRSPDYSFEAA